MTTGYAETVDTFADMDYLTSEAAQTRYVLAAYYVRDCPEIIEIGGFKTPITQFLNSSPSRVLMLDPKIRAYHGDHLNNTPCRVDYLPLRFQDYDFSEFRDYGLVILGCSLKYFRDENQKDQWRKLVDLINGARITVLEFSVDWERSVDNVAFMLKNTATHIRLQIDMDLQHGMNTPYHKRRLMVLEPGLEHDG